MKKILSTLLLLSIFMSVNADNIPTTDKLVMTPRTNFSLNPGGNEDGKFYVTVSLEGSRLYSWYQMDIVLPDGIEPIMDGNNNPKVLIRTVENGMYPPTKTITGYDDDDEPIYSTSYTSHTLGSSYITKSDGRKAIRVGCTNETLNEFAKTSGDLFRFYIKATSYAKPQLDALYLEEVLLITKNVEGYVPEQECKVEVTSNASVTASVSSTNHWSTLIIPFDATIPEGVTAYTSSKSDDDCLYLTKSETLEAYTPYILYSENGWSGTLTGTVDASKYPESGFVSKGNLNGAITTQSVTEGYVLQKLSEGVKLYPIASGSTFSIPAGKCWVNTPKSDAKSLAFAIDDETAIEKVSSAKTNTEGIYTLQGTKVDKMIPGNIYIKEGKTVLKLK